jgi:hypothetical protein
MKNKLLVAAIALPLLFTSLPSSAMIAPSQSKASVHQLGFAAVLTILAALSTDAREQLVSLEPVWALLNTLTSSLSYDGNTQPPQAPQIVLPVQFANRLITVDPDHGKLDLYVIRRGEPATFDRAIQLTCLGLSQPLVVGNVMYMAAREALYIFDHKLKWTQIEYEDQPFEPVALANWVFVVSAKEKTLEIMDTSKPIETVYTMRFEAIPGQPVISDYKLHLPLTVDGTQRMIVIDLSSLKEFVQHGLKIDSEDLDLLLGLLDPDVQTQVEPILAPLRTRLSAEESTANQPTFILSMKNVAERLRNLGRANSNNPN